MIFEHFNRLITNDYIINIKHVVVADSKSASGFIEITSLILDDLTIEEVKFLCKCCETGRYVFSDLIQEHENEFQSLVLKGFIRQKEDYIRGEK